MNIAFTLAYMNKLKDAFKYINKALELKPKEPKYYLYKGLFLTNYACLEDSNLEKTLNEAIQSFDISIHLDHYLLGSYYAKQNALIQLRKFKQAAEWSLISFHRFPSNLDFYKSSLQSILIHYENVAPSNQSNYSWFLKMKKLIK